MNKVLSFNTHTFQSEGHYFEKRQHCLACGEINNLNPSTPLINLEPNQATYIKEGGYRTISPNETVERFQHLISPITGVVPVLKPLHDDELFVYLAGQNHALPTNQLAMFKQSLRDNCAGKGINETQAKASALCEALERYSGEFQGNETRITASYTELADKAIHPNHCMLFSEQ